MKPFGKLSCAVLLSFAFAVQGFAGEMDGTKAPSSPSAVNTMPTPATSVASSISTDSSTLQVRELMLDVLESLRLLF